MMRCESWAVVLAGGEGTRLQSFTRLIAGDDRPKQFCRIFGGRSLLQDTLTRVALNVESDSTLCVVLKDHQRFYESELEGCDRSRMVEQPLSRGTGAAVAYGLRRVQALASGPAVVGFFPSDHHYANGLALQRTVAMAYNAARNHPDRVFLVGAEATEPESDYGWIEPATALVDGPLTRTIRAVGRFWEKPSLEVARALLSRGCLWNTFIVIGCEAAFSRLLARVQPEFWAAFESLGRRFEGTPRELVRAQRVYERVAPMDFSRQVLEQAAGMLAVVPMAHAGWTDLGRPARVLDVLSRRPQPAQSQPRLRLAAS